MARKAYITVMVHPEERARVREALRATDFGQGKDWSCQLSFEDPMTGIDVMVSLSTHDPDGNSLDRYNKIYLEVLERQRTLLDDMNHSADFDEELIRKYLSLIDLEEFKMREKQLHEADTPD